MDLLDIKKMARQKLYDICGLIDDFEDAQDPKDVRDALQTIKEDPVMAVLVRGDWRAIGTPATTDWEFRIVFSEYPHVTPVRSLVEANGVMLNRKPAGVRLAYDDGCDNRQLIDYPLSDDEHAYLLAYCRIKLDNCYREVAGGLSY